MSTSRCRRASGRPTTLTFIAPRFDASGQQVKGAIITVLHNGVKVHDAVEVTKVTGGAWGQPAKTGPVRLQDHGNPTRFRNIWIVPVGRSPRAAIQGLRRGVVAVRLTALPAWAKKSIDINPDMLKRITAALPEQGPGQTRQASQAAGFHAGQGIRSRQHSGRRQDLRVDGREDWGFRGGCQRRSCRPGGRQSQAVRRSDDGQHDGPDLWPAARPQGPKALARRGQGPGPAAEPARLRGTAARGSAGSMRPPIGPAGTPTAK